MSRSLRGTDLRYVKNVPRAARPSSAREAVPPPKKNTWGGRRPGAGRKPNGEKAGVTHLRRERLDSNHPLHVILRPRKDVPSLKTKAAARLVLDAVGETRHRGARVVRVAILRDSLQLIVEVDGNRALWRALQGLSVRIARRLNRHFEREGSFFMDRYEARPLRTAEAVRGALAGMRGAELPLAVPEAPVVAAPKTRLLRSTYASRATRTPHRRPSSGRPSKSRATR
jgi:hypothetical protein